MLVNTHVLLLLLLVTIGYSKDDASAQRWKEISVPRVIARYPQILENMNPAKMAHLINQIPDEVRAEFWMGVVTVTNGKATMACFRGSCLWSHVDIIVVVDFINDNLQQITDRDMYFVMYGRDELHYETIKRFFPPTDERYHKVYNIIKELPAIRMSVDLGQSILEQNKFLVPDTYMLQYGKRKQFRDVNYWENTRKEVVKASHEIPWEAKIPKVFWRGASAGYMYGHSLQEVWNQSKKYFPRGQLIKLSKKHPDKIDAGLTKLSQSNQIDEMRKNGVETMMTPSASIKEHIKYKYLVSTDGWTAAWQRVPWILASNSLLLKQQTLKVEWFDYALKPMIHYYPVKWDLSDLLEAVDFLEKNQGLAKHMVQNANAFADAFFSRESIRQATIKVLRDYAEAQNHTFTAIERQLISQHQIPYHTFSEFDSSAKQQLLEQSRFWRKVHNLIKWTICCVGIAGLIYFRARILNPTKRFKRVRAGKNSDDNIIVPQPNVQHSQLELDDASLLEK